MAKAAFKKKKKKKSLFTSQIGVKFKEQNSEILGARSGTAG
jgi:hypothetical protein